jgi:hypothetical protein
VFRISFSFTPKFSLHFDEDFGRPFLFLRPSGRRLNVSTQEIMLLQAASRATVAPLLTPSFVKLRFREAPSLALSGRGLSPRSVEFVLDLVTLLCECFPMCRRLLGVAGALSLAPSAPEAVHDSSTPGHTSCLLALHCGSSPDSDTSERFPHFSAFLTMSFMP